MSQYTPSHHVSSAGALYRSFPLHHSLTAFIVTAVGVSVAYEATLRLRPLEDDRIETELAWTSGALFEGGDHALSPCAADNPPDDFPGFVIIGSGRIDANTDTDRFSLVRVYPASFHDWRGNPPALTATYTAAVHTGRRTGVHFEHVVTQAKCLHMLLKKRVESLERNERNSFQRIVKTLKAPHAVKTRL